MTQRALLHFFFPVLAVCNVYDYFMPHYIPGCKGGCASWASVRKAASLFADGKVPEEAGVQCAMPGASAGNHECDCAEKNATTYMEDSYAGPWCYCKDGTSEYCTPPNSTVEQLNLQLAASSVVVAGFVTYEELPAGPAVAMLGTSVGNMRLIEGVSHKYSPPGRTYIMHYVAFRGLTPRQKYYYKVKSGSNACQWTDVFSFRAPYASGLTRIATYGDMGHSHYNNMQNLKADCASGAIDAIVHMGDHAYDLGFTHDRRGDAYMNVFQPVLQSCPWIPIIGNHESDDGDHYKRYEQIAAGEMIGQGLGINSSADTALGQHLSLGRLYGSGIHSTVPSNTSRYTSTDVGLIHIAGIDLMNFDAGQMAWLERDLQAANSNRAQVPWIMVAAHYQLYHTSVYLNWNASAKAFFSEAGENAQQSHRFEPCREASCQTLGEWHQEIALKLEPLLLKYGVDIYNAGHIHDYESTWPMKNGRVCQKSFENPTCPVYIVEGNGGVPGCSGNCTLGSCSYDWCRVHGNGCGAYGRITAADSHSLRYEHVVNSDGSVLDSFTITQAKHGPFPDEIVV
mmetsp:Transcript_42180/g.75523  ORF Transcript_42180/g.75523 Transcript_42180/m.75523 type:complete len:567 (-) Transcript_42180:138-1838(-)